MGNTLKERDFQSIGKRLSFASAKMYIIKQTRTEPKISSGEAKKYSDKNL